MLGNVPWNRWYNQDGKEIGRNVSFGKITKNSLQENAKPYKPKQVLLWDSKMLGFIPPSHEQILRNCLATYKRMPESDSNQGSTTMTFLCRNLVSYPSWTPFTTSIKDSPNFLHLLHLKSLQHGQSSDHTGLQGEHLIYVLSTIAPILAHRYNRVLVEGLPNTWTMHTVVSIRVSRDPLQPGTIELPWLATHLTNFIDQCLTRNSTLTLRLKRYEPHAKRNLVEPSLPPTTSLHNVAWWTKQRHKRSDYVDAL